MILGKKTYSVNYLSNIGKYCVLYFMACSSRTSYKVVWPYSPLPQLLSGTPPLPYPPNSIPSFVFNYTHHFRFLLPICSQVTFGAINEKWRSVSCWLSVASSFLDFVPTSPPHVGISLTWTCTGLTPVVANPRTSYIQLPCCIWKTLFPVSLCFWWWRIKFSSMVMNHTKVTAGFSPVTSVRLV